MVDLVNFLRPVHEHAVTFASRAIGLISFVEAAVSADISYVVVLNVVRVIVNVLLAVEMAWLMTLQKTLVSGDTWHAVVDVRTILMSNSVDVLTLTCSDVRAVCDVSIPSLVFLDAYII